MWDEGSAQPTQTQRGLAWDSLAPPSQRVYGWRFEFCTLIPCTFLQFPLPSGTERAPTASAQGAGPAPPPERNSRAGLLGEPVSPAGLSPRADLTAREVWAEGDREAFSGGRGMDTQGKCKPHPSPHQHSKPRATLFLEVWKGLENCPWCHWGMVTTMAMTMQHDYGVATPPN